MSASLRTALAAAAVIACGRPSDLAAQSSSTLAICPIDLHPSVLLGAIEDSASIRGAYSADVARVSDLGWLVVESGDRIFQYMPDGRFVGQFSRMGQGPGELERPVAVAVDPSDTLWVSTLQRRTELFGPDGVYVRTIRSDGITLVGGFTPSGLPVTASKMWHSIRRAEGNPPPEGFTFEEDTFLWASILSREGEAIRSMGPGVIDPRRSTLTARLAPHRWNAGVDDNTILALAPNLRYWVQRWTERGVDSLISTSAILEALGEEADVELSPATSIFSDGDGGAWVVGSIRRISAESEQALAGLVPGGSGGSYGGGEVNVPRVKNATYDGVLLHVSSSGDLTGARVFPDYIAGLIEDDRAFSARETEEGLIQIQVWEITNSCSR